MFLSTLFIPSEYQKRKRFRANTLQPSSQHQTLLKIDFRLMVIWLPCHQVR
jgi:hypothetical protein